MSPLDRIVFHIGTHKTGSSAVQGSLLESSEALLARGILYPRTGRGRPGHAGLTTELRARSAPIETAIRRALEAEVRDSGASVLVLSAEEFTTQARAPLLAAWARALTNALRADHSQVVAYVRPQWEYIESSYTQRVKSGSTWASFEDFLERMVASNALDYRTRLDPWREAFDELDVRPFSTDLLYEGNVVADFWMAAGLGPPIERGERFANRRPGARATEMVRTIRCLLSENRLDGLLPVRRALVRARRRIEADLPRDEPFSPLTSDMVVRVAERFAASNAEIVRRDFDGRHAELFAPPADLGREPSTWSLDDASDHELEVFAGALEQVLREVRGERPGGRRKEGASAPADARRRPRRPRRVRRGFKRLRRLMAIRARLGLRG